MWIPTSTDELEAAVLAGTLEEGPQLDFKQKLPDKKGNADLAVDVAAMTVDGGVLIYGVAEGVDGRPSRPTRIELAGAAERVDQITQTSIQESPAIRIKALPAPDDSSRGYLIVVVPPSARAPHQVVAAGKAQNRYYARGATGNRVLAEAEVARLYERRQSWRFDRSEHLRALIECAPFPPHNDLGYLHAFVRPVVVDPNRWERAAQEDSKRLTTSLLSAARDATHGLGFSPNLAEAPVWGRHGADKWRLATRDGGDPEYAVRCDIGFDGNATLFCGRAAVRWQRRRDEPDQPGQLVIFEELVAGNLAALFALAGSLYASDGYAGPVDVGVALTGIEGAPAWCVAQNFLSSRDGYPESHYLTDRRIGADELREPRILTSRVLSRFFDALVGPEFDPFVVRV